MTETSYRPSERAVGADPDDRMPPPESNLSLTEKEKETLRRWVAEGARYQPHWAFLPLPAAVDPQRGYG